MSKADNGLSIAVNEDLNFLSWNTQHLVFVDNDLVSVEVAHRIKRSPDLGCVTGTAPLPNKFAGASEDGKEHSVQFQRKYVSRCEFTRRVPTACSAAYSTMATAPSTVGIWSTFPFTAAIC